MLRGSRRNALRLGLLLALAAAGAPACDGCARRAEEGELFVGARADDYAAGPGGARLGRYPLNVNICETLVRLTPDYRVEPLLATAWEHRGGGTFRFFLRPGVVFSDGRPLTAEAVAWSFSRLAARGEPQTAFLGPDSVRVVDERTVDVTPTRKNLRLVEQLAHPIYGVLAPGCDPARAPVGTGPFALERYSPGESIAVARNPRYWGPRAPLERITFRFLPDDTTRMLALRAGNIGLSLDVPREHATSLREGARVASSPAGRVAALFLNVHGEPPHDLLAEPALRRAIALAIDRKSLVERVWEGHGELVATMMPPAVLGPHAARVRGPVYDPEKARELLSSAGWALGEDGVRARGGRRLTLTLIAWPEFDSATLEFLQGELAKAGIEVKIVRSPDSAAYNARSDAGAFDLDLEAPNQNDANPIFLPAARFYSKAPNRSVRHVAPGLRLDALVEEALETDALGEVQRLAAEATRIAVDEEVLLVPLAGLPRIWGHDGRLGELSPHPSSVNQRWDTLARSPAGP